MSQKDILAAMLLLGAAFGGVIVTCCSKRARDLFFFLLVTLSAITESLDVNFVSREWYRGTTCGFEVSLVDVLSISLLISAILIPRRGEKHWYWPASFGLILLFFLYACFGVSIADPKLFGLFELSKMIRGIIVFLAAALYVRSERELKLFVWALGVAVCYECFSALNQRYHYGINRAFGSLDDSNSLSMYLCMTAPIFVAVLTSRFSRYLKAFAAFVIALACVGVILTISRMGVITIAAVLLGATLATVSMKITPQKIGITLLVMIAAVGITAKSWRTLNSRFEGDSLKEEYGDKHSMGRGYYIRLAIAIADDHWFGVGPNNWSYWVSNKYGPKLGWRFSPYPGTDRPPKMVAPSGSNLDDPQAAPAHSLAALTVGEMGIVGLVLFTILWLRWFQMGASFLWKRTTDPMRRMGVGLLFGTLGIFSQSMTEWVYHQTPIFFTFNIILGTLASLYYIKKRSRRAERAVKQEDYEASVWNDPIQAENF